MRRFEQRLLVGVRGKTEAKEAVRGGARVVDVEYPASALGTPYPLNILAVREVLPVEILVATNIGSISREELPGLWAAAVDAAVTDLLGEGLHGGSQRSHISRRNVAFLCNRQASESVYV
jgi:uncharacterized protein (UPF0264 family)